jgi:hypothetical protein
MKIQIDDIVEKLDKLLVDDGTVSADVATAVPGSGTYMPKNKKENECPDGYKWCEKSQTCKKIKNESIDIYLQEDSKDFSKALDVFIKGAQKMIDDNYKKNYPNLKPDILSVKPGKKYIKIIQKGQSAQHESVWAFIDKETGDILKAASWKTPAKHARGNIFDKNNGLGFVTAYGPAYLR